MHPETPVKSFESARDRISKYFFLGLAVGRDVGIEIEQTVAGVEVAVNAADHHQVRVRGAYSNGLIQAGVTAGSRPVSSTDVFQRRRRPPRRGGPARLLERRSGAADHEAGTVELPAEHFWVGERPEHR